MSDPVPAPPAPAAHATPDAALAAASSSPSAAGSAGGREAKAFAWLFGAAGLVVLICCGGALSWVTSIEKVDDPARVRDVAATLLTVEVPPRFEPAQAILMPPPPLLGWLHGGRADEVRYAVKNAEDAAGDAPAPGGLDRGRLLLVRLSGEERGAPPSAREAAAQMGDGEVRTVTTRDGRAIEFAFGTALDQPGDEPDPGEPNPDARRKVFGAFREGAATYLIDLSLPPEDYDEAEVTALLESIAVPTAPAAFDPASVPRGALAEPN